MMKSIFKIFLPTVFAYFMFALTNIVDAIFVGNLYGVNGQSAMGLISPIVVVVSAVIFSIVVGSNTYLGHALGQKDNKEVNKIFNHTLIYGVIGLILLEVFLFAIIIPLVLSLIDEEEIIIYFFEYITIFLPAMIAMFVIVVLSFVRRVIGDANVVFKTGIIAILVNLTFNYFFAVVLGLGIRGIAMASLISFIFQFIYLYSVYKKENNEMFKLKFYKFDPSLMFKVFINGLSDGIFDLSNAIVQIMNITLLTLFIGSIAPSYLYVLNSILILQLMIFFSLSDSINPLISVAYGKRNLHEIKHVRNNALILSFCIGIMLYFILLTLKSSLFTLFGISDIASRTYLFKYSNIYFSVVFVFGLNQTFIAYLTAIGWSKLSLALGVMRNIIVIVFVTLLLTSLYGEIGLWSSYFVSEVISFIIILLVLITIKPLKREIKNM